jgi:hypothetical protein
VGTGVKTFSPLYTSVLNEVVCLVSTNQPVNGNNNYFVTQVINTNEFDYWRIDGSGVVRENGTYTCGNPNGGER